MGTKYRNSTLIPYQLFFCLINNLRGIDDDLVDDDLEVSVLLVCMGVTKLL